MNDAFTMYITRLLQGATHARIFDAIRELIQKFGAWFIQFPTFSYIRIYGFQGAPHRFHRYPSDHLILLEVTRKICAFDVIVKKDMHKSSFCSEFPLRIRGHEACPSLASTQFFDGEIATFNLPLHTKRLRFDRTGGAQKKSNREFRHKDDLEDYWENCKHEFEVLRKKFSRFSIDLIRLYSIKAILD